MFDLSELARWDEVLAALASGQPTRETAPRREDSPVRDQRPGRCPMGHEGARA